MLKRGLSAKQFLPVFWGGVVGIMGGLIGLGGAEFRLPILIRIFHYSTLQAIIINLIVSLVTVIFSLLFRNGMEGFINIANHFPIILNILAGSLLGSYLGVNYATGINEKLLTRIVIIFLVMISFILIGHELIFNIGDWQLPPLLQIITALIAGIVIGIFSGLLGVAGGELIIPTIILIFAIDIQLAGNLSLAISMPTILMGLFKYNQQDKLKEVKSENDFLILIAIGSVLGAFIGSYFLQYVTSTALYWILGIILLISAFKLAKH